MFSLLKKESQTHERNTDISNQKRIWALRPSIKGTQLLFIVIKAIIIIVWNSITLLDISDFVSQLEFHEVLNIYCCSGQLAAPVLVNLKRKLN